MNLPFSVLIITLNEEKNLHRCLSALHYCNDVVVLDSFSTDNTSAVAEKHQARFYKREFDNYARQRNYGLSQIIYKHKWLLMVDADEVVPEELVQEIMQVIESGSDSKALYCMRRKDHLFGKWLKRSSGYPTWFGRLMKIGYVRVEREINEEFVTEGKVGYLQNHLYHYPFNKGFSAWLEKHNRYSTMEAELIFKGGVTLPSVINLFSNNPIIRRKAYKSYFYRVPGRPLLMFVGLYIFKLGFLDGAAGLTFCILRSFYEFLINCKVKELRCCSKSLSL